MSGMIDDVHGLALGGGFRLEYRWTERMLGIIDGRDFEMSDW